MAYPDDSGYVSSQQEPSAPAVVPRAAPPAPAPEQQNYYPTSPVADTLASIPGQVADKFPGVRAVLSGSGDDINAAQSFPGKVGQAVRGAAALIPAAASDFIGRPVTSALSPVLDAASTAFTGQAPGPISTAAAKMPAPIVPSAGYSPFEGGFTPSTLGGPATPSAPSANAAVPGFQPAGGQGGGSIEKQYLDANGRPTGRTYTWNGAGSGSGPDLGQQVRDSDGHLVSAAIFQQREQAKATAAANDPILREQQFRQQETDRARSLMATGRRADFLAGYALMQHMPSVGGLANEQSRQQQQAPFTQAQTQHTTAQAGEAQAKAGLAVSTLVARQAYAQALASGDEKQIETATARLRGIEGKWEKEAPPDMFHTTALPPVIGQDGSRTPGGAIVTNKRTGQTRIIYGSDTQPGKEYEVGKIYSDAKGRRARWDGKGWVAP